jgi:adenosylcobinamide amidohydrolase
MKEREVPLNIDGTKAKVIYHTYKGFEVKTLLVSLGEKSRIISTREGYKEVSFVANHYNPRPLWDYMHQNYQEFEDMFPSILAIPPSELAFLTTGADMDNLAVCERSYQEFMMCCLATAGVRNNAQRMGVDKAGSMERDGRFENLPGTINIILLTNATLNDGAMARTIITATEAKTAALQDMDIRSTYTPENQATGTGTDNMIVVSGKGPLVKYTGGHAKMGELIGVVVKMAVAEAVKRQEGE